MDHIIQLKKIRADAIARMRTSDDFKLAGKLGLLIVDLGETVDDIVDFDDSAQRSAASKIKPFGAVAATSRPFENTFNIPAIKPEEDELSDASSKAMIDELVAEIEGDAAELDAIMAEDKAAKSEGKIGPFIKTEENESPSPNGASH